MLIGAVAAMVLLVGYAAVKAGFWRKSVVVPHVVGVVSPPVEKRLPVPVVDLPKQQPPARRVINPPVSSPVRMPPPLTKAPAIAADKQVVNAVKPAEEFVETDIKSVAVLVYGAGNVPEVPLRDADRVCLANFLKTCGIPAGSDPGRFYALKNDVMDRLWNGGAAKGDVLSLLAALYQNRQQDDVVRDYAVQHLGQWYQEAPDKMAVEKILRAALTETQNSIAGSALLALSRLSETHPELDRSGIANTALKYASSDEVGNLTRLTALQVCSEMGIEAVVPAAERLAQPGVEMPIRISAIAVLGHLGGVAAVSQLEKLTLDSDPWVVKAAQSALKCRVSSERTSL